ncbi:MAG: hypothetical protein HQM16_18320, partial [Deltaproteobacteria bacterium]|nr:hypothetical protein [Deltaproteobacteria bacterium]
MSFDDFKKEDLDFTEFINKPTVAPKKLPPPSEGLRFLTQNLKANSKLRKVVLKPRPANHTKVLNINPDAQHLPAEEFNFLSASIQTSSKKLITGDFNSKPTTIQNHSSNLKAKLNQKDQTNNDISGIPINTTSNNQTVTSGILKNSSNNIGIPVFSALSIHYAKLAFDLHCITPQASRDTLRHNTKLLEYLIIQSSLKDVWNTDNPTPAKPALTPTQPQSPTPVINIFTDNVIGIPTTTTKETDVDNLSIPEIYSSNISMPDISTTTTRAHVHNNIYNILDFSSRTLDIPYTDTSVYHADIKLRYTRLPKNIFTLLRELKNPTEKTIFLCLYRKSYGWGKSTTPDPVSYAAISRATGISTKQIAFNIQT